MSWEERKRFNNDGMDPDWRPAETTANHDAKRIRTLFARITFLENALRDVERWCGMCPYHVGDDIKVLQKQVEDVRSHANQMLTDSKEIR